MRVIQCELCGESVEVNGVDKYCSDCRKIKKMEWQKKTNAKKSLKQPPFEEKMWR